MKKILIVVLLKWVVIIGHFNERLCNFFFMPLLKMAGMKINGVPRYIAPSVSFDDFNRIVLGGRIIIAREVKFLTHDYSYTTLLIAKGEYEGKDVARMGRITVGHNVFIGYGSIILPGTVIGDNVIIGAGSVVRGKIENGQVVLGNPARPVMSIDELYDRTMSKADSLDLRIDRF